MIFKPLPLRGAWLIEPDLHCDDRGFFTRLICEDEFAAHRLKSGFMQSSMSYNIHSGTLRGMHFQAAPHAEAKLVRVTVGKIFDVIIDLRPESETYLQSCNITLSAENHLQLYIPEGFAHGFQTLVGDTEVCYHMTEKFNAPSARGFLWSDPAFAISWPLGDPILSPKDAIAPRFTSDLLS